TRDGNSEIYVMNADGSNAIRLTNDPGFDIQPRWSPDGTRLNFMHSPGPGTSYQVYLMNADGSNLVQLTQLPYGHNGGSWSPDGSRLVTVQVQNGGSDLVVTSPTPGAPFRILKSLCCPEGPAWSPRGTVP